MHSTHATAKTATLTAGTSAAANDAALAASGANADVIATSAADLFSYLLLLDASRSHLFAVGHSLF